jgi:hypothetical protein
VIHAMPVRTTITLDIKAPNTLPTNRGTARAVLDTPIVIKNTVHRYQETPFNLM